MTDPKILHRVLAQSLPPEAWDGERYLMPSWMYEEIQKLAENDQLTEKSIIKWDHAKRKVWAE